MRGGPEGDGGGEGQKRGEVLGEAQNLTRRLMEAPASFLTPTQFCEEAKHSLAGLPVELYVRDKIWAEERGMGSFLSVAQGSAQPPKFLEMHYRGGEEGAAPAVFVGKGVTFDTGGISIKPSAKMDLMRGDMGGAAVVTSCIQTDRSRIPMKRGGDSSSTSSTTFTRSTHEVINFASLSPSTLVNLHYHLLSGC